MQTEKTEKPVIENAGLFYVSGLCVVREYISKHFALVFCLLLKLRTMRVVGFLLMLNLMMTVSSCGQKNEDMADKDKNFPVEKPDSAWKQELTPIQFHVLRESGTERPYTGKYDDHYKNGTYHCAACGEALFESDTKYNAGCGWPSFWEPKLKDKVEIRLDKSHGMIRDEVLCANCGGHLGHVFNDGPEPTGKRYCINSAALEFKPE